MTRAPSVSLSLKPLDIVQENMNYSNQELFGPTNNQERLIAFELYVWPRQRRYRLSHSGDMAQRKPSIEIARSQG